MTDREKLIKLNYEKSLVESMTDKECKHEVEIAELLLAKKALYRFCAGKQIICVPANDTDDDFLISNIFTKYESFLTTIESQKEEIEKAVKEIRFQVERNDRQRNAYLNAESTFITQQAITELAVKGLQRVINIEDEPHKPCLKCDSKGYHHGFGEHGHDPDYCTDCGGIGEIFVGQTEVAADTLSEIERLQNAQT